MRARYYNIDIKRFINQDVVIGSIDSSMSLNRYAYVEGNPVSYLDPFGLDRAEADKIMTVIQGLIAGAATVNLILGNVLIAHVLTALVIGTDLLSIAFDILLIMNTEGEEQERAIDKLVEDIVFTIVDAFLIYLGNNPGMSGGPKMEEISQAAMNVATTLVGDLIFAAKNLLG